MAVRTTAAPATPTGLAAHAQRGAPRTGDADLLARYRPGSSSFFASPGGGAILGEGVAAVLPAWSTGPSRAARLADLLDDARRSGHPDPVALGALPFDEDLPTRLMIPASVRRGQTADLVASARATPPRPAAAPARGTTLTAVTSPDAFLASVQWAVAALQGGALEKVVLSRALQVMSPEPVDAAALLRVLVANEPSAYTFAIDLPRAVARAAGGYPARPTRTLLGASPELLLRRRGTTLTTHPLAGSAPRAGDLIEDRRRALALAASAKDRGEHAVVVEAIADALAPLCSHLVVPSMPSLVETSTMLHLGTRIEGELRADVTSLEAALALHPTPAICGRPPEVARAVIAELEPYDREFYTGLVGWMEASGDGEWAVTIRCAQVEGTGVRLYAGAGIMADSDPGAELRETAAKTRTLLRAMGIDAEPGFDG